MSDRTVIAAALRPGTRIEAIDGRVMTLKVRKTEKESDRHPGWWLVEGGGLADSSFAEHGWKVVDGPPDEATKVVPLAPMNLGAIRNIIAVARLVDATPVYMQTETGSIERVGSLRVDLDPDLPSGRLVIECQP